MRSIATSGADSQYRFPNWGRCFWQDGLTGDLFLAFASGTSEVDYISSVDSGNTWSSPSYLFPIDDFNLHPNFDIMMDSKGNIHSLFRYNDSGCYSCFARTSDGVWSPSGLGAPAGFCIVEDTGTARSINGSLHISEGPPPFDSTGDGPSQYPSCRIAIKESGLPEGAGGTIEVYRVDSPFDTYPVIDLDANGDSYSDTIRSAGGPGPNGGYPVWVMGNKNEQTVAVTYYNELNGGLQEHIFRDDLTGGGDWTQTAGFFTDIDYADGEVRPNEHMAIGSGSYWWMTPFVAAAPFKEIAVFSSFTDDSYNRMIAVVDRAAFGAGFTSIAGGHAPWGVPFSTGVCASGYDVLGAEPSTHVDFTITNELGQVAFYVQDVDRRNGHQVIKRFLASQEQDYTTTSATTIDVYRFTDYSHPSSGVKHIAPVSADLTGGDGLAYWKGFKAAKHNRGPGDGNITKGEFIATNSIFGNPSGSLIAVWNVQDSVEVKTNFSHPYFAVEYTSGNPDTLVTHGYYNYGGGITTPQRLFDNTIKTGVSFRSSIPSGAYITVEFSKPVLVDRAEFYFGTTHNIGKCYIYGSNDPTTFTSGTLVNAITPDLGDPPLVRATAATGSDPQYSDGFVTTMEPVVGKYIRFVFDQPYTSTGALTEIKLFGPGQTRGFVQTEGDHTSSAGPTITKNSFRNGVSSTQKFDTTRQGELPANWSTYGDFSWEVRASGDLEKQTGLPSESPITYGLVQSGVFTGDSIGNGDGSAVRNQIVWTEGSGVLETTIEIAGSESSRTISWDFRADIHTGDTFQFFTVENGIGTGVLRFQENGESLVFWRTRTYTLSAGNYTLRWVYNRSANSSANRLGAVWIDNVVGLDGPVQPSINAYLNSEVPYETGYINSYLSSSFDSQINAFTSGAPFDSQIHAYLNSQVSADATSSINSYLKAMGTWIHAFVLSSDIDARTYPTGTIFGYVCVASSGGDSTIHGYARGNLEGEIYGYARGYGSLYGSGSPAGSSGDPYIHGYVLSQLPFSSINASVNASGDDVATSSRYALLDARYGDGFQVIHAYLSVPSGSDGNIIHGYAPGWELGPSYFRDPQSMVYGYLKEPIEEASGQIHGYMLANYPLSSIYGYMGTQALVASGGGSVGGGPGGGTSSTSNVEAGTNWVWGVLKAHDGFQFINAYLKRPSGVFPSIHGYTPAGGDEGQIHAYLWGNDLAATGVHGFASGIEFESFSSHGWAFGASGIEDSQIHGYLVGVYLPDSRRFGVMISSPSGTGGSVGCVGHNMALRPVPTVTIPVNCMNG